MASKDGFESARSQGLVGPKDAPKSMEDIVGELSGNQEFVKIMAKKLGLPSPRASAVEVEVVEPWEDEQSDVSSEYMNKMNTKEMVSLGEGGHAMHQRGGNRTAASHVITRDPTACAKG